MMPWTLQDLPDTNGTRQFKVYATGGKSCPASDEDREIAAHVAGLEAELAAMKAVVHPTGLIRVTIPAEKTKTNAR